MPFVPIPVEDPADPRLEDYLDLRDPARRRRFEAGRGLFVVEGWKAVDRLLASGLAVRSVVVTTARAARVAAELTEPAGEVPLYVVPRPVLDGAAGYAVHRGVLAIAARPAPRSWEDLAAAAARVLVLEAVNDQENLGALFRIAAGLGVDAVLLSPTACDPLYRRSVRVSMGASFLLPWARVEPWPSGLDQLAGLGWVVAALHPAAERDLDAAAPRLRAEPRVAILLGSEGEGLTKGALAAATDVLSIPMAGGTDSLNVTVAAAIAAWAVRPVGPRGAAPA